MAEERHHHLFHHKKDEDEVATETVAYGSTDYQTGSGYDGSTDYQTGSGYDGGSTYVEESTETYNRGDGYEKAKKEEKHHKNLEHVGEFGTVAAGAFAMYEKHESKKDPEHAHRHKIEEEVAAAAAVGSGGFAFHEHHEKKEAKKEEEEFGGKKHHHLF